MISSGCCQDTAGKWLSEWVCQCGGAGQLGRAKDLGTQPGPRSEETPVPAGEGPLGEGRAGHRRKTSHQRRDQKAGVSLPISGRKPDSRRGD